MEDVVMPGIWGERVPEAAMKRWGPAIEALLAGRTLREAAGLVGSTGASVYRVGVKLGVHVRQKQPPLTPELEALLRETLLKLRAAGIPTLECAAIVGLSDAVAGRLLSRRRYNERRRGQCAKCGAQGQLDTHHVSYVPEVVAYLCRSCHRRIHAYERHRSSQRGFVSARWSEASKRKAPARTA
jgi:hypothetical protein